MFFPERGESASEARSVCARCPVQAECFEFAAGEVVGVWAGTTGQDRRRLRATPKAA